jgi:hypothetical protein
MPNQPSTQNAIPINYYSRFIQWLKGKDFSATFSQPKNDNNLKSNKWFQQWLYSELSNGRISTGESNSVLGIDPTVLFAPKTTIPGGTVPLTDTTGTTYPPGTDMVGDVSAWEYFGITKEQYEKDKIQARAIGMDIATYEKQKAEFLAEQMGIGGNKGISAEYQAGLEWEKQKFGMQQDLANQDYNRQILGKQMEDSSAYAATVWKGIQENNPLNEYREDIKQQLYDEFERGKKAAEDSLEPADFVGRYLTKSVKNPNNPPRQTNALEDSSKQLEQLKVQKDYYTEQLKALNKNIKDPENPTYMDTNTKTLLSFVKAQIKDAEDRISTLNLSNSGAITPAVQRLMDKNPGSSYMDIMQAASEYMNNPGAEGTVKGQKLPAYEGLDMETKQLLGAVGGELYYEPYTAPKEPELDIPDWLRPMVEGEPSSVKGTDVKKWASAITPSGQGWNRLVPTQKNMFASYADKTGRTAEDLYSSMQMQLPKTLQLGRNWSASKRFY